MKDSAKKKLLSLFIIFMFAGSGLAFAFIFAFPLNNENNNIDTNSNIDINAIPDSNIIFPDSNTIIPDSNDDIVHWHATLNIEINGEKIEIPSGIGTISGSHTSNLHTHEKGGIIHKEGPASTHIGDFFDSWGRTFNSECIFEFCNTDEKTVKFYVNGIENSEFGNYVFFDDDIMTIAYS